MGNSLEDYLRPDHPADDISQEMIKCVETIVLKDHLIKTDEFTSVWGISNGSDNTIIQEHLGMSKVYEGHLESS